MGDHKKYSLFIAYGGNIVVVQYPDYILNELISHDNTLVEIGNDDVYIEQWDVGLPDGKDGRLDIAYTGEERKFDDLFKEKRWRMAAASNVFLRHIRKFIVPKDYYKTLIKKWCAYTGAEYKKTCELLDLKEE